MIKQTILRTTTARAWGLGAWGLGGGGGGAPRPNRQTQPACSYTTHTPRFISIHIRPLKNNSRVPIPRPPRPLSLSRAFFHHLQTLRIFQIRTKHRKISPKSFPPPNLKPPSTEFPNPQSEEMASLQLEFPSNLISLPPISVRAPATY